MKTVVVIIVILSLHWGSSFSTALQSPHLGAVSSFSVLRATPFGESIATTTTAVKKLKKVLEREYVSFFDPMQREFYAESVSFDDPMTSLSGVGSYQNNVDMLSSRTIFGKFFFNDASIVLHSITGGEVNEQTSSISNIITRWSLRVTVQALPWQPTARFTGISEYEVVPGGSEGVLVQHQTDYWDSINIQKGGKYAKVDKGIAIKDFLNQLGLGQGLGNAAAAAPEVPYSLLRRGNGYEVRKYPSYSYAKISYSRRDEGYDLLASVTQGMDPLSPAIMEVFNDDSKKTMAWPLAYAAPGESSPPPLNSKIQERMMDPIWSDCEIKTVPGTVVAVGSFSDASVAPIVRKVDKNLRAALENDGISIPKDSETSVKFAQYDAIFTLGKRRGEVWIELEDGGHPW